MIVRMFRKYHRQLAIILSIPLLFTVITGVGYTIFDEWLEQEEIGHFLIELHSLELLHLEKFFPLLNALGLIGLIVTGLSMTSLFKQKSRSTNV
ncbi:conserved hypothetical protein [Gloeothece citriformis PCC 7424]|uniref:Peptidase n=1 Tax=Gloeothece citriformis (strain PCC 7424) TaxID=65393 RepID=B7KBL4_GLOC7|nr:hypothetical protein [Gloeothece citriformis]ACK72992.1 conserved hypothetical protein [Gloeothece citriformis PCC 7424]